MSKKDFFIYFFFVFTKYNKFRQRHYDKILPDIYTQKQKKKIEKINNFQYIIVSVKFKTSVHTFNTKYALHIN